MEATILTRSEKEISNGLIIEEVQKSQVYKYVRNIIANNKKIADREKALGYENIEEKAMGTGGVYQLRVISGFVYMQIGYGHGKWNYASVVRLGHVHTSELGRRFFVEDSLFSSFL